jgi:carbon storage regulator
MLVLSRTIGEEIVIGAAICITVVAVQGDRVRIGINAPNDVLVDRQEVHKKRQHWRNDGAEPEICQPHAGVFGA